MKRIFLLCVMTIISASAFSQKKIKQLKVFCTDDFNPGITVTVPLILRDRCHAVDLLKNSLVENGFKVIEPQVADAALKQANALPIYALKLTYNYKLDDKCTPYAMTNMAGQVIDLLHEGNIVATFSYAQSFWSLGAKCTPDIMDALAGALKTKTNNK